MLTYTTKLDLTEEDRFELIAVLESQRFAYNECSNVKFNSVSNNSITDLHKAFYHTFRVCQPKIPSQIVISAEQECLSAYRSIKSNKHKINKPIQKKKLSLRLDARSFSFKKGQFSIISLNKRVKCKPVLYPKLENLINKRKFCENQSYILANAILKDCKANVIVVEDLKGIKVKKHNKQNKNSISQVPFYKLKQILTYKAPFYGKLLLSVNPAYTSKIDHRTGKIDGSRQGRRYYGKDGIVLDADQNAAINIALRSKLPVSYITVLDGQAIVNSPNVFKSTP